MVIQGGPQLRRGLIYTSDFFGRVLILFPRHTDAIFPNGCEYALMQNLTKLEMGTLKSSVYF